MSLRAEGLLKRLKDEAHDTEPRGYFSQNRHPMTQEHIAKLCGLSPDEFLACMPELERAKLVSPASDGTWFVPEIVRQETQSKKSRKSGRLGGNPRLKRGVKGGVKGSLNPNEYEIEYEDVKARNKRGGMGGKPLPADYGMVVGHIRASYTKTGRKFGDKEAHQIKNLLGSYPGSQVMGMWDVFVSKNWNWEDRNGKTVVVPRDLETFWVKITIILEGSEWKSAAKKHEIINQENVSALNKLMNGAVKKLSIKEVERT